MRGKRNGHPGKARLEQRSLHMRSLAVLLTLEQRCQKTDDRPHARAHIDEGYADANGWPVGFSGDRHDTGGGLRQRVVTGLARQRTALAEGAYIAPDQRWIVAQHLVDVNAEFREKPRPQILDNRIRLPDKALQQGCVGRIGKIERQALLASIESMEGGRVPLVERRPPASRIVSRGRILDLDHPRAEFG
jgi:hypothetical protein